MLNRWVSSRDRKTATEGAEVTRSGRLFQTRAAATGKARSPTVDSRVRLTISDEDELERSRWRTSTSATWQSSSIRYAGAETRTAAVHGAKCGTDYWPALAVGSTAQLAATHYPNERTLDPQSVARTTICHSQLHYGLHLAKFSGDDSLCNVKNW